MSKWFERQTREIDGVLAFVLVPAEPTEEDLRETPWYYVKAEDVPAEPEKAK